jgi:hypothetical protein
MICSTKEGMFYSKYNCISQQNIGFRGFLIYFRESVVEIKKEEFPATPKLYVEFTSSKFVCPT